ncbi:MAG: thioredoxin fold domain-containing protein [Rhodobacterales bacterium]
MKRQRKSPRHAAKAGKPPKAEQSGTDAGGNLSRRDMLRLSRNGAAAAVVLGLGGWGASRAYAKHTILHDLSGIGTGIPTVVQIHDPQCPMCRTLQKRTLQAAKAFDETALQVRVANIRSAEGRVFADRYGVTHVTLLLFDGQGEMQTVVQGLHEVEELRDAFSAHLARFPSPLVTGS